MNVADLSEIRARQSVKRFPIRRVGAVATEDVLATEEPLEIRLGYTRPDGTRAQQSVSITMRTPGNDEELAIGFLYSEGIVRHGDDVQAVAPCGPPAPNGLINVVRVELGENVDVDLARLERHFYTSSSCGVCGKASLEAVAVQGRYDIAQTRFTVNADVLGALPERLKSRQAVFEQTGGLHASGLFSADGELLSVREDVGRHNALDKLIGRELVDGRLPLSSRGILVSGRASFELMQKAMMAGCPLVAAVGAPSSLAVELAAEFGITLVGFLKPHRFNVYTRDDRVC